MNQPRGDKLQKLLAHAGRGSRREIEKWIDDGRITVNGKRARLGDRATSKDRILLDGKLVVSSNQADDLIRVLIYHKPEGEICTRKDPQGRPTVFESLPSIPNGRWVAVGRLDINTSGLILFTNHGELANRLMHPSTGIEREYLVRVRGKASDHQIEQLTQAGVMVDGKRAKFERVVAADLAEEGSNHWYRVVIKEGRYREVRKLWEAIGCTVSRLKRIRYGTVKLTRDVKRGHFVKMAPKQLERLVHSVGLGAEFAGQLYSGRREKAAVNQPKSKARVGKKTVSRDFTARHTRTGQRRSNPQMNKRTARKASSATSKKTSGR